METTEQAQKFPVSFYSLFMTKKPKKPPFFLAAKHLKCSIGDGGRMLWVSSCFSISYTLQNSTVTYHYWQTWLPPHWGMGWESNRWVFQDVWWGSPHRHCPQGTQTLLQMPLPHPRYKPLLLGCGKPVAPCYDMQHILACTPGTHVECYT